MSKRLIYRARWSFPERSEALLAAGRLMASWSEEAARALAPELDWSTEVVEHADYGVHEDWQASHVVRLHGVVAAGRTAPLLGRGQSRLAAGGRGRRVGGTGRIRIETVGGFRRLDVNNHCDVTHWDIDVGPVSEGHLLALSAALETAVDAEVVIGGERRIEVAGEPLVIATSPIREDLALWTEDLEVAGFEVAFEDDALRLVRSSIDSFEGVDQALVTLGEVLAEAGESEWEQRALDLMRAVPQAP